MTQHEMNWFFGFVVGFVFCRIMVWMERKVDSFFQKLKKQKETEKPFANQFTSALCDCGAAKAKSFPLNRDHKEWCPVKKFP